MKTKFLLLINFIYIYRRNFVNFVKSAFEGGLCFSWITLYSRNITILLLQSQYYISRNLIDLWTKYVYKNSIILNNTRFFIRIMFIRMFICQAAPIWAILIKKRVWLYDRIQVKGPQNTSDFWKCSHERMTCPNNALIDFSERYFIQIFPKSILSFYGKKLMASLWPCVHHTFLLGDLRMLVHKNLLLLYEINLHNIEICYYFF